VAEKERFHLGCKVVEGVKAVWGGSPGTPGETVEPSGDVVGLSTKH